MNYFYLTYYEFKFIYLNRMEVPQLTALKKETLPGILGTIPQRTYFTRFMWA